MMFREDPTAGGARDCFHLSVVTSLECGIREAGSNVVRFKVLGSCRNLVHGVLLANSRRFSFSSGSSRTRGARKLLQ